MSAPVTGTTAADLLIVQRGPTLFLKAYKYSDPGVGPTFIALAPNTVSVAVTNLDASNTLDVSLAWGIDG